MPRLRLPSVIAPTDVLPSDRLDYVAIHAHPDDESIDYGALLARMSAAGLRGAVVLLTDGEGGRDQYPWRAVGDGYPARDLAGNELARVRGEEAREAVGWLGAGYLVRFGLPNQSYNSIEDERSPAQIIDGWGGEAVVARIADVIAHFRPRVVVAPEGPNGTREHFEHEATGLLVRAAIERLRASDSFPLPLVLQVIDPLQVDGMEGLVAHSPWEAAADGSIPRLRQMLALLAHRTQRDATVVGVETRLALGHEYYRVAAFGGAAATPGELGLLSVDLAGDGPYSLAVRRTE